MTYLEEKTPRNNPKFLSFPFRFYYTKTKYFDIIPLKNSHFSEKSNHKNAKAKFSAKNQVFKN